MKASRLAKSLKLNTKTSILVCYNMYPWLMVVVMMLMLRIHSLVHPLRAHEARRGCGGNGGGVLYTLEGAVLPIW